MTEKLKPCPFCGVDVGGTLGAYIGHPNIPTNCPGKSIIIRPGDAAAIAAWNNRTLTPPSDEEIEAVARALERASLAHGVNDSTMICSEDVEHMARAAIRALNELRGGE